MIKKFKLLIEQIKTYFAANPRARRIGLVAGVVVVVGLLGLASLKLLGNDFVERRGLDVNTVEEPEEPPTRSEPLTGLEVAAELAERHVTAIMIENSPQARPQSALADAGVVFEAVTEGGITRFLAFYQAAQPELIGPVRSLRTPFLDWIASYDAAVAHVGGSADALNQVASRGLKTMTQFRFADAYWRSTSRMAPHNMYTAIPRLDVVARAQGFGSSDFASYRRKEDAPLENPTAERIAVNFSSPAYNVVYNYRAEGNHYRRTMGGAVHTDQETGQPIEIKNVVVLRMPTTYSGQYAVMETIGSGNAVIFRDGGYIEGTWRMSRRGNQLELLAADNSEISLNRGNTWFSVLPLDRTLSY